MTMSPNFLFTLFVVGVCKTIAQSPQNPSFEDVTFASGITQRRSFKFGGPCVTDIDNDGMYDLLLSYHALDPMQIFFGEADGTFTESNFKLDKDIHGVNVAQRTARSRERIISVSIGGGRGKNPRAPFIYQVTPDRNLTDITFQNGFGQILGRGRLAIFMDLSAKNRTQRQINKGGPDGLFINFLGKGNRSIRNFAYENVKGQYMPRRILGFDDKPMSRAEVTDVNGDGIMEVLAYRGKLAGLQIYKLTEPFKLIDASQDFLPNLELKPNTVSSVAELDMDNDGDFDLYVARTDRALITNSRSTAIEDAADVLLRNDNGKYVDVTAESGIPNDTFSMGVTVGDFNNDGYVDLMVSLWQGQDMILLNQGNGTFKRVNGLIPKAKNTVGHHAVAVDYNLDGRVDLVVAQGDIKEIDGKYRLMKNTMPLTPENRYLLVRVANAPDRGATSLHAVVVVFTQKGKMTRRIGSRGAQAGGGSYLDTVHFGLGKQKRVRKVSVKWSNGYVQDVFKVTAGQKLFFGVV